MCSLTVLYHLVQFPLASLYYKLTEDGDLKKKFKGQDQDETSVLLLVPGAALCPQLSIYLKSRIGPSTMVQWVKAPSIKPDNLSLIP